MKTLVLMIAVLAALLVIGGAAAITVENDDTIGVKIYLHSDGDQIQYNMSTMGPGTGAGTSINAGSTRDYLLNQSLHYNLFTVGDDLGGGDKGYRARLGVDSQQTTGDTEAMLQVIDGSNDYVVAQSGWIADQTDWLIPFNRSSRTNYTFNESSSIILRISVRTDDPVYGYSNIETDGDYYLNITCTPIALRLETDIYDHTVHNWLNERDELGDPANQFHPNIPDQLRFMNITGTVRSAFGSYDVRNVTLTMYEDNGGGEIVFQDQITVHENTYRNNLDTYKFYYLWWWNIKNIKSTELDTDADNYRIYPSYNNPSGVKFKSDYNSPTFDMLEYAVYMRFDDWNQTTSIKGTVNSSVQLGFRVYNSGMSSETILLEARSILDWNVTLDKTSFSLPDGDSTNVTATIEVPGDASPPDTDTVQVEARLDEAPAFSGTINFDVEADLGVQWTFTNVTSLEKSVRPGNTIEYGFKIQNIGSERETFNLRHDTPPTGWSLTYHPSRDAELEGGTGTTITIRIKAPATITASTVRDPTIYIYAQPEGMNEHERKYLTTTHLDDYNIIQEIVPETATCEVLSYDDEFEYSPATFAIEIFNGEDDDVDVTFQILWAGDTTIDSGEWTIDQPNDFDLDGGGEKTIEYSFTPESDIEPNTYEVEFIVLFNEGNTKSESASLLIDVEEYVEIVADKVGDASVTVKKDQKVTFQFDLMNSGNKEDTFEIRVSGVDSEWDVWIDGVSSATNTKDIVLEVGEEKTIDIELVPPKKASGEEFVITVNIKSANDQSAEQTLSYTIDVKEESDDPSGEEILERMLPLIALVVVLIIMFAVFKRKSKRLEQ